MTDPTNTDDTLDGEATNLHQHTFDPATDSVSEELVYAVAEANDAEPTELAILSNVVDPDALDSVFRARSDGQGRTTGQIVFTYEGHPVEITADGIITIGSGEAEDED